MARIFIVDDDLMFLQTVEKILQKLGYDVDSSDNPIEALEKIKATHYDLVLTDLQMPEMNGIDVAREIVKLNRDTEILLITGYATLDAALQAMKVGIYDIILKPASLNQIKSSVGRALEKLRLERENRELMDALKRKDENVQLLQAIGQFIKESPNLDEILFFISETLNVQMNISQFSLFHKRADKIYQRLINTHQEDPLHGVKQLSLSREVIGAIFQNAGPYGIKYEKGAELDPEMLAKVAPADSESRFIMVPLIAYSDLVGFFLLDVSDCSIKSREELMSLLEIFCNQLSYVFYPQNGYSSTEQRVICTDIRSRLENYIRENEEESPMNFCIIYLEARDLAGILEVDEKSEDLERIITAEFPHNAEIERLTNLLYLVAIPEIDFTRFEIEVSRLHAALSRYFSEPDTSNVVPHVNYASYPSMGKNVEDLLNTLTKQFA